MSPRLVVAGLLLLPVAFALRAGSSAATEVEAKPGGPADPVARDDSSRRGVRVRDGDRGAAPVLRHRVLVGYRAEAEGVGVEDVIARLLETVPENEG